jgi:hypothetical protein
VTTKEEIDGACSTQAEVGIPYMVLVGKYGRNRPLKNLGIDVSIKLKGIIKK